MKILELIVAFFSLLGMTYTVLIAMWLIRVKPKYDKASKMIELASREQRLWLKYLFTDPEKAEVHKEDAAAAWKKYNEIIGPFERKK